MNFVPDGLLIEEACVSLNTFNLMYAAGLAKLISREPLISTPLAYLGLRLCISLPYLLVATRMFLSPTASTEAGYTSHRRRTTTCNFSGSSLRCGQHHRFTRLGAEIVRVLVRHNIPSTLGLRRHGDHRNRRGEKQRVRVCTARGGKCRRS
jgi:hypothetical protein